MSMKRLISLLMVSAAGLLALPAAAQMNPGDDVTVNLGAIPRPPGAYPGFVLHRPVHHRRRKKAVAATETPAADATADTTPAATASAPEKPAAHPKEAQAPGTALPFTFGEDEPIAPATKEARTEPAARATKPAKTDSEPAGPHPSILFEHDATDPQSSQLNGIKLLATDLNSALAGGATGIELLGYGGAPGDKSSDARRIALKRATAIRQILIDNGVPAERINVRAMGGITDGDKPDRVDIIVRSN